jgi:hypothetical protein
VGPVRAAAVLPFDVLVAGSRGTAVAAALIAKRAWAGPTLLLSGAGTLDCIAHYVEPEGGSGGSVEYYNVPICLYHGTEDDLQRIAGALTFITPSHSSGARCMACMVLLTPSSDVADVRTHAAAACHAVTLVEATGEGHDLPSLATDGGALLVSLLLQTVEWGGRVQVRERETRRSTLWCPKQTVDLTGCGVCAGRQQ